MDYDNVNMTDMGGMPEYNENMTDMGKMPEYNGSYNDFNQQPPEVAAQEYLNMMNAQRPYSDYGMDNMSVGVMSQNVQNMNMPIDPPQENAMNEDMKNFLAEGYLMGPDCFGTASQIYAQQLMEYINDEYRDYLYYTILSKRSISANARRIFRNIAADELKHSRRFASAYFLITGKRYLPTRSTVNPIIVPASYNQALRDRYIAESKDAVKYRQFASSTTDRCLKRMAMDTSNDERSHAHEILALIQGM